jgi:hypothetical protein
MTGMNIGWKGFSNVNDTVKKRWFLTVDWCSQGKRGIFCSREGEAFGQETPHTEEEIMKILDVFFLVLSPKSVEMSFEEVMEHTYWHPLGEFVFQYGYATKPEPGVAILESRQ